MKKLIAILLFALAFKVEAQNFPQAAVYPVQTVRRPAVSALQHFIQQGKFYGNGSATQSIKLNLVPIAVFLKDSMAFRGVWKLAEQGTDSVFKMTTDSGGVAGYCSFSHDTMTVKLMWDMNLSGHAYYWVAFAASAGEIMQFQYRGTGSANTMHTVGIFGGKKPAALIVQNNTLDVNRGSTKFVSDNMTGDSIAHFNTQVATANSMRIGGIDSLVFDADLQLNTSGILYRGLALCRVTDSIAVDKYVNANGISGNTVTLGVPNADIIIPIGYQSVNRYWHTNLEAAVTNALQWTNNAAEYQSNNFIKTISSYNITIGTLSSINPNSSPNTMFFLSLRVW